LPPEIEKWSLSLERKTQRSDATGTIGRDKKKKRRKYVDIVRAETLQFSNKGHL